VQITLAQSFSGPASPPKRIVRQYQYISNRSQVCPYHKTSNTGWVSNKSFVSNVSRGIAFTGFNPSWGPHSRRNFFGRFLFLEEDEHFLKVLWKPSLENVPRKISGKGCTFSKLLSKNLWKNLGKYVGRH